MRMRFESHRRSMGRCSIRVLFVVVNRCSSSLGRRRLQQWWIWVFLGLLVLGTSRLDFFLVISCCIVGCGLGRPHLVRFDVHRAPHLDSYPAMPFFCERVV